MLVISERRTATTIVAALQAGAVGYVLKERDDMEIALSIRSMLRGGVPIDPFVMHHILPMSLHGPAQSKGRGDLAETPLSKREIQILGLMSQGLTNREISQALFLSHWTVEDHIKAVYRKLTVSSRTKAVFVARTHGWLP
jgi:DNA-binding NarL/FixJ family response regulator